MRPAVRQELARPRKAGPELFEQRAPTALCSAHEHEDLALVEKVAPLNANYNYRSPCFRDLQTQNAYLRGQLAKVIAEAKDDVADLEYHKGQVHELTVHRAVLHKENERLLAEQRDSAELVRELSQAAAATHARHVALAEEAAVLRVQLEDAKGLNASLRDELRTTAHERAAEAARADALGAELRRVEAAAAEERARLQGLARAADETAAATALELSQAYLMLGKARGAQEAAVSKFDELALQHRALHSLSASQVALAESLGEQLSKARGDARSATRSQDDASVLVVAERERHVATTQALSAAQLEVERMQAKLKWLSERYSTADGGMGSAELKLRDARAEIEQLHSRMALYSQWVGVGGQDALKMRQWSRHDQQLRARLQAERGAHDQAWFRAADLQAAAARAGSIY